MDLKYYTYQLVLYFYSWFKISYSYWFPTQNTAVVTYVWNNHTMRRFDPNTAAAAAAAAQQEDHLLYYVLYDGSILVFQDAQRMREVVAMLLWWQEEGEGGASAASASASASASAALHRSPFRYFMEAEIATEKTLEEDVLPLLTSYDDGHGTFFQDLTHYALTPADLYNFNSGRHVIYDDQDEFLRVTPMATLEPRTIAAGQKIAMA